MSNFSSQDRAKKLTQLKLNAAKAFLSEKRQSVAIAILEAVDDPQADRLLEKIGAVTVDDPRPSRLQSTSGLLAVLAVVGIVCFMLGVSVTTLGGAGEILAEVPLITNELPYTDLPQAIEVLIPTLTIDPQLDGSRTEVVATFEAYHMSLTATQAVVGATQTASSQEE